MPERENTEGRTCYREPNMAHPQPSATPGNTKEWERDTWVARMAPLSNFWHHLPGNIPTPDDLQPAPSTYMTLMYNLHYTLSTTNYHAPTDHWVVHGTDSLLPADYAPPPQNPGLDTYTRVVEPDDPHIWGTWGRKSLDTLLSIRSGNQGLGRATYLERVSDVPCLLLILKTLIAFQKMFPGNCKKVKSTNKEHHKQDQSRNCDSILPNQSIVSKEGLHMDK